VARGLDHIVHAVRDLDAAAEFYDRAGFLVGARNVHPWGTHNRVVQLNDVYIEILAVVEPDKIVPAGERRFSFGAFHREFLARRQGLSMILLKSRDAHGDARQFREGGIGDFEIFEFARRGLRPDGTVVQLAFSLAFAREANSPDVAFATCQHHFPENFWNPDFQRHANGARHCPGAVLVADHPGDHAGFLLAWTGVPELSSGAYGLIARTPNGDIAIMTARMADHLFGMAPVVEGGAMTLGALRIGVRDIVGVEASLQRAGLAARRHPGALVVGPDVAHGATLVFEPNQQD
jgi:hypothetical protein